MAGGDLGDLDRACALARRLAGRGRQQQRPDPHPATRRRHARGPGQRRGLQAARFGFDVPGGESTAAPIPSSWSPNSRRRARRRLRPPPSSRWAGARCRRCVATCPRPKSASCPRALQRLHCLRWAVPALRPLRRSPRCNGSFDSTPTSTSGGRRRGRLRRSWRRRAMRSAAATARSSAATSDGGRRPRRPCLEPCVARARRRRQRGNRAEAPGTRRHRRVRRAERSHRHRLGRLACSAGLLAARRSIARSSARPFAAPGCRVAGRGPG